MYKQLGLALAIAGALACPAAEAGGFPTLSGAKPLVIAHRGASGYLPEHTIEAYRLAIAMGADVIEPDLVSTKDGVLIARHEPDLTHTTNVSQIAKFASRKRKVKIDSVEYEGWFANDFTLAEIKELRATQQRANRDPRFNGAFEVPTLQEVIELAKKESQRLGRTIQIYPETKHPTWHRENGVPLEEKLVETLNAAGWTQKTDPVFIQSFEVGNLKRLRGMTKLRLVQLTGAYDNDIHTGKPIYLANDPDSAPWDFLAGGDKRTYADMITPAGLAEIATYADGVGPWKRQFIGVKGIDRNGDGKADDINGDGAVNEADGVSQQVSTLIQDAHKAGLLVHPYTYRDDVPMARDYAGDATQEFRRHFELGVDGLFTDFADTAVKVREQMAADVAPAVEYTLAGTPAKYFRTTAAADLNVIAGGAAGAWTRTTDTFHVWTTASANGQAVAVCRYLDTATTRHFYGAGSSECAALKAKGYADEGTAFYAVPTTGGACAAGTAAVDRWTRAENGVTVERLVGTAAERATLGGKGWTRVGVAFCGAV